MVYFLVLVVFVKVLVVFSEIGVVLVVFGSGGSETLNPTLKIIEAVRDWLRASWCETRKLSQKTIIDGYFLSGIVDIFLDAVSVRI